jgi:hypothetical protein
MIDVVRLSNGERLAPEDFPAVPSDMFDGRKSSSATRSQWSTLEVIDAFGSLGSGEEDGSA